jgi:hypothetical protein
MLPFSSKNIFLPKVENNCHLQDSPKTKQSLIALLQCKILLEVEFVTTELGEYHPFIPN